MSAANLADAYNAVADRYTGDVHRDLAEANIPPDLAIEISQVCFAVGLMTAVDWMRKAGR